MVGPLGLSVGLGMVARGQTHQGIEQKARQTRNVSWVPRSETMSWCIPCSRKMCWVSRALVSATEGSLGRGTKCTALENLSTTVNITLCPCEGGRPVMKSRAM